MNDQAARLSEAEFFFPMDKYLVNQAMVNEGIKSVKGKASSMKSNMPPITPNFPPNIL